MVQARALATRARILDQAVIAFGRDGYDAASLTGDILEPAGVSVGSFYHQFDNKLDVLFALLSERQEHLADELATVLDLDGPVDTERQLTTLVTHLLDRIDAEPLLYLIQLRERWNPDDSVRSAVRASWVPWRQAIERLTAGTIGSSEARASAVKLVGSALLPTMGQYLDRVDAERTAWREREVPAFVAFCLGGLAAIG